MSEVDLFILFISSWQKWRFSRYNGDSMPLSLSPSSFLLFLSNTGERQPQQRAKMTWSIIWIWMTELTNASTSTAQAYLKSHTDSAYKSNCASHISFPFLFHTNLFMESPCIVIFWFRIFECVNKQFGAHSIADYLVSRFIILDNRTNNTSHWSEMEMQASRVQVKRSSCTCAQWTHFFSIRLLQLLYNSATIENDDDICGAAENYLEAFVDIESLVLDNSFTETDDLMAFTDRAKLEQTELWVPNRISETENKLLLFWLPLFDLSSIIYGVCVSFYFRFRFTSDILCKEDDGRISLAYERLPGIPKKVADQFASKTHTLDLSYNDIKWVSITIISSHLAIILHSLFFLHYQRLDISV